MKFNKAILDQGIKTTLSGLNAHLVPRVLAELAHRSHAKGLIYIASDGAHLGSLIEAIHFFAPGLKVVHLPSWDCVPYDRVSPSAGLVAKRMEALSFLYSAHKHAEPFLVLTTAHALMQKLPPQALMQQAGFSASIGQVLGMEHFIKILEGNGFMRTPTVREQGEYAVRGGILDLFAPGHESPVRLDFFGDTLETIRSFDPNTQRTKDQQKSFTMAPMSEIVLNEDTIKRFRQNYQAHFGVPSREDTLYQAISEGRRIAGYEHWLPFFYERVETLFDLLPQSPIMHDELVEEALKNYWGDICDHYKTRIDMIGAKTGGAPYNPIEPDLLYLQPDEIEQSLKQRTNIQYTPFARDEMGGERRIIDLKTRQGKSFAAERASGEINIFEAVKEHAKQQQKNGKKVLIACWSQGSAERMEQVLKDHDISLTQIVSDWSAFEQVPKACLCLSVLPIEKGVEADDYCLIAEQDILGDRFVTSKKRKKSSDALTEATSLSKGDLIVHAHHGIGQFKGLKTVEAAGAPHDCLILEYAGGDKLFLPVENIDLLTRYGSEEAGGQLDKLGGGAWQARKAKLKKRIREIADKLIKIAAARALKTAPEIDNDDISYQDFVARFPYDETEDQLAAIESIMEDLGSGKPMDRLVCGDVGFGKTEVALRAAFATAMSGRQVAIVVPTTLLSRQHFKTFAERFKGFPLTVRQASRFVGTKELRETKEGLKEGTVDVVIGTHALLGKAIKFKDLGLLIIDEEQHFGVNHKERLKEMKSDVHVLTLSATPIPRTLQLALTGVRELSLIATPPVDRLAVRSFVAPFDTLMVREALLREHFRGGQSFFVCPRLKDLDEIKAFLDENVPEVRVGLAHGQMPAGELDERMSAFYDGQFDVLLSTTIVESGLDIPRANTLIVHRADMFGLAQLYQIRGRVGRSKTRAYALFTVSPKKALTANADRRLQVLQSLENLGAGFQLASHDLDIRGAGNLLGDEQSGHIKEVGFELYQTMLEEAVASLKAGDESDKDDDTAWSPQITIGVSVMIPENYVNDLSLRMQLYKRLAELEDMQAIQAFGAELVDRFGSLPDELESLLKIVYIKSLCKRANVEKVDAGPKGAVITLRNNEFPNPEGLVKFLGEQAKFAKMKPDHRIVFLRDWPTPNERIKGAAILMQKLSKIA